MPRIACGTAKIAPLNGADRKALPRTPTDPREPRR